MDNSSIDDRPIASCATLWRNSLAAGSLVVLLTALAFLANRIGHASVPIWPDFAQLQATLAEPLSALRWLLGDMSEAVFYKHELAAVGMLLGAALAYRLARRGSSWQGFSISYGSGLWPWVLLSSSLGLVLSNLLWDWTVLESGVWQPTFVAFVSLPAALVLMYGGGWKVSLLGAVVGALLVTPCSLLLVNYLCMPLGLPNVIGNVSGMAIGSAIAFSLLRNVRWLAQNKLDQASDVAAPVATETYGASWTVRRILADFTESPFFGNEWASVGLIGGVLLALMLNPYGPAYGSGLLPQILCAQVLASAIGVLIWRSQWQARGWYPTYVPVVSVAPAVVLTYGGSPLVIGLAALLGALMAPPLAAKISDRLPAHYHPYIGNVLSMAASVLVIVPLIGCALMVIDMSRGAI